MFCINYLTARQFCLDNITFDNAFQLLSYIHSRHDIN